MSDRYKPTTRLRAEKRYVQQGRCVYVIQQWMESDFQGEEGYWKDIPVVDEDGRGEEW